MECIRSIALWCAGAGDRGMSGPSGGKVYPNIGEAFHLLPHSPRGHVAEHVHVGSFQDVDLVRVQVVGPAIVEATLGPLDKDTGHLHVRLIRKTQDSKHAILEVNASGLIPLTPFT